MQAAKAFERTAAALIVLTCLICVKAFPMVFCTFKASNRSIGADAFGTTAALEKAHVKGVARSK